MTWLDQARGTYVRSPKFVRQSLRPILGIVPAQLKFGGTYRRFRHDIDRAAADPVFASTMHVSLLRRLLGKAHAGSPFYKRMIDQAFGPAFDPALFALEDLRHLPIVNKKALREAGEFALAVPRGQVDASKTSGSNAI
jgi:phenylacetate-CoA ligase